MNAPDIKTSYSGEKTRFREKSPLYSMEESYRTKEYSSKYMTKDAVSRPIYREDEQSTSLQFSNDFSYTDERKGSFEGRYGQFRDSIEKYSTRSSSRYQDDEGRDEGMAPRKYQDLPEKFTSSRHQYDQDLSENSRANRYQYYQDLPEKTEVGRYQYDQDLPEESTPSRYQYGIDLPEKSTRLGRYQNLSRKDEGSFDDPVERYTTSHEKSSRSPLLEGSTHRFQSRNRDSFEESLDRFEESFVKPLGHYEDSFQKPTEKFQHSLGKPATSKKDYLRESIDSYQDSFEETTDSHKGPISDIYKGPFKKPEGIAPPNYEAYEDPFKKPEGVAPPNYRSLSLPRSYGTKQTL